MAHCSLLTASIFVQITCLYDMDIPRPDNFNETYLYEGTSLSLSALLQQPTEQPAR